MTKLEFQPSLAIEKEIERKKRMFQRCVEIRIHSLLLAGATLVCSLFVLPVLFFVLYKVLYRNRSLRQDQLQLHQFAYRRFAGGFFSGPLSVPQTNRGLATVRTGSLTRSLDGSIANLPGFFCHYHISLYLRVLPVLVHLRVDRRHLQGARSRRYRRWRGAA